MKRNAVRIGYATLSIIALLGLSAFAVDPTKVGAKVDESMFANGSGRVIHVDNGNAAASDANPGTDPTKPKLTISAGLAAASSALNSNAGVKVSVHPGVYREGFYIPAGNDTKPLVLEGTEKGKVIISGSMASGWELSNWQAVPGAQGLYKKAWPYHFGFVEPMGCDIIQTYTNLAVFRRELACVNGVGLSPVQLENFSYNYNANPRYIYNGYNDVTTNPSLMPPGTFAVNSERDDHPDSHTMFIRLPAGVDPQTALVEVSRDSVNYGIDKGNTVFRNLIFQQVSIVYNSGAVWFHKGAYGNDNRIRNVLIEDCQFNWTTAIGLDVQVTNFATVRRCIADHNANSGMVVWYNDSTLLDQSQTNYNDWAADLSGDGWVPGGIKSVMNHCVFNKQVSSYNAYIGLWFDCGNPGNSDNLLVDCITDNNKKQGVLFEIAQGPNYVLRHRARNNGSYGLETTYGARLTHIDSSVFVDNWRNIGCNAQHQTGAGSQLDTMCLQMTNCYIKTDDSTKMNVMLGNWDNWLLGNKYYIGSNNTYCGPREDMKLFADSWTQGYAYNDAQTFAQFQTATGQDQTSKWDCAVAQPNYWDSTTNVSRPSSKVTNKNVGALASMHYKLFDLQGRLIADAPGVNLSTDVRSRIGNGVYIRMAVDRKDNTHQSRIVVER